MEADIHTGKTFRTVGGTEAAEMLLTNGYVLPEDLAGLVKHRQLTAENTRQPTCEEAKDEAEPGRGQAQSVLAKMHSEGFKRDLSENRQEWEEESLLSAEEFGQDPVQVAEGLLEDSQADDPAPAHASGKPANGVETAPATRRVVLRGREEGPLVLGKTKRLLTRARYDVVKTALEAPDGGWTKDQLISKSGHEDALGVLRRLAEKDPDWAEVIHFAGQTGGGYWIK